MLVSRAASSFTIRAVLHPAGRRCSSVEYARYSQSSRLAQQALHPSRCDNELTAGTLGPWMKAIIELSQASFVNVGVDLSRRDICVTQHRLHRPQVGTVLEQMGCEAVPQNMRRQARNAESRAVPLEDLPESLPRQRVSKTIHEHGLMTPLRQCRSHLPEITADPLLTHSPTGTIRSRLPCQTPGQSRRRAGAETA